MLAFLAITQASKGSGTTLMALARSLGCWLGRACNERLANASWQQAFAARSSLQECGSADI